LPNLTEPDPGGWVASSTAMERPMTADPQVEDSGARRWQCQCGQAYRISGEGRHRLYWPEGAGERDAVMDGCCVNCRRPLPGKHAHCKEGR
jgi:hypothetical protein